MDGRTLAPAPRAVKQASSSFESPLATMCALSSAQRPARIDHHLLIQQQARNLPELPVRHQEHHDVRPVQRRLELSSLETALDGADIVVFLVAHRQFRQIPRLLLNEKMVIDTCGALR